MILFQTNSNILSRLKKERKKEKKPRKLFQKRFIRIPFLSNSSTLPSFHSSPEKAKSAANAADSLNSRMRTTFSSGEIAVVNPRRVNSENSKLAAVLEAKWKKKKKKIKRRVGSRLHNDSSVRVVYVCSWEEEMLERIYRQGGWGNYRTKRRGPGWQTGELSIIRTLLYDLERLPGSLTTPILFYELDLDRIARFSHGNARFKNDSIVHWLIMVRLFDDIWIRWSRWEKMWILWMIMDG